MKNFALLLVVFLASLFSSQLEALHRDIDDTPYCLAHTSCEELQDDYIIEFIPATGPECTDCYDLSIYSGYVDSDFRKYFDHLKKQLSYTDIYPRCSCFWPEYSQQAAEISDTAYLLFRDLISTTALTSLLENEREQRLFINNPSCFLNKHGLAVSFIAQQFHFSDYYRVCRDIENYAISKYEEKETAKIIDSLEDILEVLYSKFLALYSDCYAEHPNRAVDQEIRFMRVIVGNVKGLEKTRSCSLLSAKNSFLNLKSENLVANLQTFDLPIMLENKGILKRINVSKSVYDTMESDILLEHGTLFNNLLLYKEAIQTLTQAIYINPSNKNAYIERAYAYFETNQIVLALQDYESAKKLTIVPPFSPGSSKILVYLPNCRSEYSKGLVAGITEGSKVGVQEFIPSIFSCLKGTLNGLWAFVCSPIEVSKDVVYTTYAMGEFIYEHNTEECLQCVVPELKELSLTWNKLSDYSKGQKVGYIIGKYGIEIFAPAGFFKGANKFKAVKRANTMCTLENCAVSEVRRAKILEESAKWSSIRGCLVAQSVKEGKILVKNANSQIHIMQRKHAWEKLIKISGNVEEDCKRVVLLLEENGIYLEKYRVETLTRPEFIRYNHEMMINGQNVKAVFNKNPETGEIFLNDAWVITR